MAEPGASEQPKFESPTVKNILEGNSTITHVGEGDFLQTWNIGGQEYWRSGIFRKLTSIRGHLTSSYETRRNVDYLSD
jgi:hypothetical protein